VIRRCLPKTGIGFNPNETEEVPSLPDEVQDTLPVPSEHINLVFIGHVDHGKSTLCGRILLDTGGIDERSIEKYKAIAKENIGESWSLAVILDEDPEERRRGKTIDFARSSFRTNLKRYTILDAPGHRNYVPLMIDGALQADLAILTISARASEFESGFQRNGQTREHIILAKTLGISKMIIVINKMDDPTVLWSMERFDLIRKSVSTFLSTVGFLDVPFVPISAFNGINISGKPTMPSWYQGQSLIDILDALPPFPRQPNAPLVLPIFIVDGDQGRTNLCGKVEMGTLRVGEDYVVVPSGERVRVGVIHPDYASPRAVREAPSGENVRMILEKGQGSSARRGSILCLLDYPVPACDSFVGEMQLLKLPASSPVFSVGFKSILHLHTEVIECEISELICELEKNGKKTKLKKTICSIRCSCCCEDSTS